MSNEIVNDGAVRCPRLVPGCNCGASRCHGGKIPPLDGGWTAASGSSGMEGPGEGAVAASEGLVRSAALLEAAASLEMSDQTIRLHAGELSAQEMRAVKAALRWKAGELRKMAER